MMRRRRGEAVNLGEKTDDEATKKAHQMDDVLRGGGRA